MKRPPALVLVVGLLCVSACSGAPKQPRPERRPDKAELFGDAGLVPTRQGELARLELASAGEVERALEILPAVLHARVHVESREGALPRVLVVAEIAIDGRDDELDAVTQRIVGSVLGPADLEVILRPPAPPDERTEVSALLLLAILALGVSLGVSFERGKRVLARSRHRARRRRATG